VPGSLDTRVGNAERSLLLRGLDRPRPERPCLITVWIGPRRWGRSRPPQAEEAIAHQRHRVEKRCRQPLLPGHASRRHQQDWRLGERPAAPPPVLDWMRTSARQQVTHIGAGGPQPPVHRGLERQQRRMCRVGRIARACPGRRPDRGDTYSAIAIFRIGGARSQGDPRVKPDFMMTRTCGRRAATVLAVNASAAEFLEGRHRLLCADDRKIIGRIEARVPSTSSRGPGPGKTPSVRSRSASARRRADPDSSAATRKRHRRFRRTCRAEL
jgi:hypothetical protein